MSRGFVELAHYDDFLYNSEPTNLYETNGTFSTVTGKFGRVKWATSTAAGGRAHVSLGSNGKIEPVDKIVEIKAKLALTDSDEQVFAFIGAFEALPTAADPPVESDDGIYFRLKEQTSDANWFAVTRENESGTGGETATDTGIAVDLDTDHEFKIRLDTQTSQAEFFIDGTRVATQASNLPLVDLIPAIVWVTGDGVSKAFDVDSLAISAIK